MPGEGAILRLLRVRLPRLYLQRFPLLLGALLLGYVPFALLVMPAMFRSTLVLTAKGLASVTLFAVVAAIVVLATRRTVLICGPSRFRIRWPIRARLRLSTIAAHLSLAAPVVVVSTWMSADDGEIGAVRAVLASLAGCAGAAGFLALALFIYARLVDAADRLPDLVIPETDERLQSVHGRDARVPPERAAYAWLARFRPFLGPGYFGPGGRVLPAHLFAAGIFAAFALLYAGAYVFGNPKYDNGVPALVFVLIVATFATIVLAGVAFFLDRHRLPTLLPLVLWIALLSLISTSDHYFALRRVPAPLAPPTPYQIARTHQTLLTVVAVDGGGIQAAAWGAKVLTEIEKQWPGFHRSARLISGVSGGSVGTMYFLGALRAERAPTPDELDDVVRNATRGSLSEAGWGLAYPDLARLLVPIVFYRMERDRGWAIERAWRRNFRGAVPTLGEWIEGVRSGWRPSMALNATIVESGQRFAFATFQPQESWQLATMTDIYPNYDIDVPSAARLSATFPYVTPVATALPGEGIRPWHFADGGYYDNTGMVVAMRWLDAAMLGHETEFENRAVAFIRIRSGPPPIDAVPRERAWSYEAIGPLQTLMSVRTAGQRERAETELDFLQRLWCRRGVEIRTFEFGFDLPIPGTGEGEKRMKNPPLSWQLTPVEVRDLDLAWKGPGNTAELTALLALKDAPAASQCRFTPPGA
jgi:hypothetical protein